MGLLRFLGTACCCLRAGGYYLFVLRTPTDAEDVLNFVREHAADLRVDRERIGICAFSGNGPTALSLLVGPATQLQFAVMCNTYMLDLEGDTTVADMAARIGFAAPNSGRSVCDLDQDMPIFLVRSGRDETPGLNQSLDRFAEQAIESNLPLRLVNLPHAPHGFDTLHDTEESKTTIQEILTFMRAPVESAPKSGRSRRAESRSEIDPMPTFGHLVIQHSHLTLNDSDYILAPCKLSVHFTRHIIILSIFGWESQCLSEI